MHFDHGRLMTGSFILLACFLTTTTSFADDGPGTCKFKDQKVVSHLPPLRSQDGVGFCYAFASTVLLDQYYCKNKEGGCHYPGLSDEQIKSLKKKISSGEHLLPGGLYTPADLAKQMQTQPDDRLSVLDAIAASKKGALVEGGFTNVVLESVRAQGSIALERCAPFDMLMASDTSFFKLGVTNSNWWQRLQALFQQYEFMASNVPANLSSDVKQKYLCEQAHSIAESAKQSAALVSDVDQIMRALADKDFANFVKDAVIPETCAASRKPLKPFAIGQSSQKDPKLNSATIERVLRTDTPIAVSMCSTEKSADGCGGHAVVVAGQRQKCCAGQCTAQYRVVDSAGLFWAETKDSANPYEAWVSADEVLSKISKLPMGSNTLSWIK